MIERFVLGIKICLKMLVKLTYFSDFDIVKPKIVTD